MATKRIETPGHITHRKPLWRDTVEAAVGAVFIALIIITFIARPFTVDGPSMLPTLSSGERLVVEKLTYRFRPPTRGDIVVFRYPADVSSFFIKRVIGVPGDTVEFFRGRVFINGEVLPESYVATPTLGPPGPTVVPEGHYFVLGDNRTNSQDSRSPSVGFVPTSLIVGRAVARYWPFPQVGRLTYSSRQR